ncbi:formiminoglutamate deiminase [Actinopolyspora lacussalsi]|nr:formiminoglutamate deiminase [Actinopolyspora lacussalsi]
MTAGPDVRRPRQQAVPVTREELPERMSYWCEWAWLQDGPGRDVLIETDGARITGVTPAVEPPPDTPRLRGLTLPGAANVHSHAFHRALRGRGAEQRGTFWTWRDRMYRVAERLDPDTYYRLALGVYAEMVLAGFTAVGEFHYLHHAPGGQRYDDPNAMSAALVAAAREAGIRLTLLDTCYLSSGFGPPPEGVQTRFSDDTADEWAQRVHGFDGSHDGVILGAALHSVRAVPKAAMPVVREFARTRGVPLHVHLSEQRAENDACLAVHGRTPTQLLEEQGMLRTATTAVHATHPTAGDIARLGRSGAGVCLCPTTESDLADGTGPADELSVAGCPLSLGSDGHSVIDPFAEARAVESGMRLRSEVRGHFSPDELTMMATGTGHRALGWPDAGSIELGARADLVTLDLDSPRLAGVPPRAAVTAATSGDVTDVVVDGRRVVREGVHQLVPDVAGTLRESTRELVEDS